MTRHSAVTLAFAALALSGCGEESTELPVDGRDIDGASLQAPASYSGRVIDGYLRNARVWLDVDGDYQYTPGPLTVELGSGISVTLPNGEPTAMSGEGGQFTLDTSELSRNAEEAADLDPRDYALIAIAIPGTTEEETRSGNLVLNRGYRMSAPAGVTNITPLTTLQRAAGDLGQDLRGSLANINLQADYILAGNERAHTYARALARFMALHFPEQAGNELGDGTETVLSGGALNLLRIVLVDNAAAVVDAVDEFVAGGAYTNVSIDELALPQVRIDLDDPVLLTRQVVRAHGSDGGIPASRPSAIAESAELEFRYNPAGQLQEVMANGCMEPDMKDLVRLANAGGMMAATNMQGMVSVSLSQASRDEYTDEDEIDERLVLDWAENSARFHSSTACLQKATGGDPEREYTWTLNDAGQVSAITDGQSVLRPDYTNASQAFFGYTLEKNSVIQEVTISDPPPDDSAPVCDGPYDPEDPRVVSYQQSYSFGGGSPYAELDWDIRGQRRNLLSYGFSVELEGGSNLLEWEFLYQAPETTPDQVGLVETATLSEYNVPQTPQTCGREVGTLASTGLYAIVTSEYSKLSDYLAQADSQPF
ncbi:hypothetical protein [Marinobacter salicampi]|uniref:hypothetical protein n=1 Tax=Marinobacter salicampi TaxID=435907 RepID=UPI00140E87A0|nr:hypothetical protein [Marinobacter salicampi]